MTVAIAFLLGSTAIAVWFLAAGARSAARVYLRFASTMFAALAAASAMEQSIAREVALLVAAVALPVLALATVAGFKKPLAPMPATLVLGLVCLAGLVSVTTGIISFALVPATFSAGAILLVCGRQFYIARSSSVRGIVSALALLAFESSFALDGATTPCLMFAAAGLLGLTLALGRGSDLAVEVTDGRDLRRSAIIGGAS